MKAKELRNKSTKELHKNLADARAKLAKLNVEFQIGRAHV